MNKKVIVSTASIVFVLFIVSSCKYNRLNKEDEQKRFFNDESFWNTKIPLNPVIDERSNYWISLLKQDASGENFGINLNEYTIPVYEVDSATPTRIVQELPRYVKNEEGGIDTVYMYGHHVSFKNKPVPIPPNMKPSPGRDMHVGIIDWQRMLAWDMWHVEQLENGTWASYTGMHYPLDGSGIFDTAWFAIKDGESIHQYGPGRAAGVPVIAGLVMHDEVLNMQVEHKLACAVRYVAFKEFVHPPATWTDGNFEGGIPEGAIIQLDPELDLSRFDLSPGEKAICKAMQYYGMVVVDFAKGNCLYGEGLWSHPDKSWDKLVRTWNQEGGIRTIPLDHYRVLKIENTVKKGDKMKKFFQDALNELPPGNGR